MSAFAKRVDPSEQILTGTLSLPADVLGALLRGGQPLQEPAHLHRVHRGHVPRQEAARDAAPYLRHIGGGLSQHAARYSLPLPPSM